MVFRAVRSCAKLRESEGGRGGRYVLIRNTMREGGGGRGRSLCPWTLVHDCNYVNG